MPEPEMMPLGVPGERTGQTASETAGQSGRPPLAAGEPARPDSDSRVYALAIHLLCLLQVAGMIAALVMWLTRRDTDAFVDANGRGAVNFQLSVFLYMLCCFPLICMGGIGFPLLIALGLFSVVCSIIAGVTAYEGRVFRYPLSIPFIS